MDPTQIATDGPDKGKLDSAKFKLFAFVVMGQVRLPLNGHASADSDTRGLFHFYAFRSARGADGSIFGAFSGSDNDPDGKGIGPFFF